MVNEYALTTRTAIQSTKLINGTILKITPEIGVLIDTIINSVSASFEGYCDRLFLKRYHTEYYKASNPIRTYQHPITSVSGINYDPTWRWDDTTIVDASNYSFNDTLIYFTNDFDESFNSVKIEYEAGYETVPYDIEFACIQEVIRSLDNIKNIGVVSKTEDVMGSSTYITSPFLNSTKAVLDRYRDVGAF